MLIIKNGIEHDLTEDDTDFLYQVLIHACCISPEDEPTLEKLKDLFGNNGHCSKSS